MTNKSILILASICFMFAKCHKNREDSASNLLKEVNFNISDSILIRSNGKVKYLNIDEEKNNLLFADGYNKLVTYNFLNKDQTEILNLSESFIFGSQILEASFYNDDLIVVTEDGILILSGAGETIDFTKLSFTHGYIRNNRLFKYSRGFISGDICINLASVDMFGNDCVGYPFSSSLNLIDSSFTFTLCDGIKDSKRRAADYRVSFSVFDNNLFYIESPELSVHRINLLNIAQNYTTKLQLTHWKHPNYLSNAKNIETTDFPNLPQVLSFRSYGNVIFCTYWMPSSVVGVNYESASDKIFLAILDDDFQQITKEFELPYSVFDIECQISSNKYLLDVWESNFIEYSDKTVFYIATIDYQEFCV